MLSKIMQRLEDCISFQIGKASQQVSRRARELLAPHGVTPVQYAALKALSGTEGMSGTELGARLVLDSASITGIVDRLEALGFLERRPGKADRRVQQLMVTSKAKSLQPVLDEAMDRLNEEAAQILGAKGEHFAERLRRLADQKRWATDV
jgi:DNA-binding MarR family transcriptional regulator